MKTPFPYFGNKSRVAGEIWKRFGDTSYYFEPFAGTLATLLNRPESSQTRYEYAGDLDCQITNFFRAAKLAKPEDMARLADWPASQLDLEARADWLRAQRYRLHHMLKEDPNWFDLDCAAWYAWVQSVKVRPNESSSIVQRSRAGVRRKKQNLTNYFTLLRDRLRDVTIWYGQWTRLATDAEREAASNRHVAILLDPPYSQAIRQKKVYEAETDVSPYVRRWAVATAIMRPKLKIALCGYAGEHRMPADWEELSWTSQYGRGRERVWFSPSCSA